MKCINCLIYRGISFPTIGNFRLMHFEILGDLANIETIATGSGIREIARLRKLWPRPVA